LSGTRKDALAETADIVRRVVGAEERPCCNRARRLTPVQRNLYRWVLRAFAEHGQPPVDGLFAVASSLGLDLEQTLARLAEEDLVHRDPRDGELVVAYPFSGTPTAHRVELDGGKEVYAMCAVDALGIPFMLGQPGEIRSRDPLIGSEINVRIEPGVALEWRPDAAVVLWGATGGNGPSAATCCQFVHFFSSGENARGYLAERPRLTGEILGIPVAAEAGKAIFGNLLGPDGR
jgi:alkylmercury lyase-like protein